MGKLIALKDVTSGTLNYLEASTGKLFGDPEGVSFLRELKEETFIQGEHGRPVLDKHGRRIHLSDLANAAAEHYYASMADSLRCDIRWQMRDAAGFTSDQISRPGRSKPMTTFMRDDTGRLVAMDLAITDVHTAAALPNYAAGYHIAAGVADVAAPVILVAKQQDVYNTWNTDTDFKRKIPNASAPGGAVPTVNPVLVSPPTYTAEQYALGGFIPTEVLTNADTPLQPMQKLMQMVVDALRLEREIRVANLLQTSGNWQSTLVNTITSGSQWDGGASGDPVANIHKMMEQSYMDLTGLVWSELVEHDFVRSSAVQKYFGFKDRTPGIPDTAKISEELGFPKIYTGRMKYVTGGALTYVWGNHVVGLHQPPVIPPTDQMEVATAVTFRWNGGTAPDGTVTGGFLVRSYYDPKLGPRGSSVVVVTHNDAEVQTSGYVGGLILNAHI